MQGTEDKNESLVVATSNGKCRMKKYKVNIMSRLKHFFVRLLHLVVCNIEGEVYAVTQGIGSISGLPGINGRSSLSFYFIFVCYVCCCFLEALITYSKNITLYQFYIYCLLSILFYYV